METASKALDHDSDNARLMAWVGFLNHRLDRPDTALGAMETFLNHHGLKLARRNRSPDRFPPRHGLRIDRDLFDKMKHYALQ